MAMSSYPGILLAFPASQDGQLNSPQANRIPFRAVARNLLSAIAQQCRRLRRSQDTHLLS